MLTDDDRYSPWGDVATFSDVVIGIQDLPSGSGWWAPERRVILLDKRLSQVERRCVLAHELEHVRRGDDAGGLCAVLHQRQEYRANVGAARRLITLPALVNALLWSQDEHELADELHVTVPMVRARLAALTDDEHAFIDAKLWEAEGLSEGSPPGRGEVA